ncbi:MAG: DUF5711 family protein [Oscillospiraceae bacterium]|nr:DUF5711 family protein [Oscillospiraceae bacterium]
MANKHLTKLNNTPETPEAPPEKPKKETRFRREKAAPAETGAPAAETLSRRDVRGALIALGAALLLFAACIIIWLNENRFNTDDLTLSVSTAAVAEEEYIFDAGSGQVFAAVGDGLAVATSTGLELLDGDGNTVVSTITPMDSPAIAACDSFAVFYDLGGTAITVVDLKGSIETISPAGTIISLTVSEGGYVTVATEYTGYRALVEVYDSSLELVYQWYSSSAWVMSGLVSPDGRQLAVLSYTSSGSEVRLFSLSQSEQQAAFSVSETILLDVHWFSSNRLCALSAEQVIYFDGNGEWQNTYDFNGQYLTGYAFGDGFLTLALSPYRAGTSSVLVSLDSSGREQGQAELQSGIIWLNASDSEVIVLVSDSAILYSSSMTEKGRLTGLTGFKYAMLRSKGEVLLAASNYAEVYIF